MNKKPNILCYASGSSKIGFGHLFRLTRFIDYLKAKDRTIFLFKNLVEKDFLNSRNYNCVHINKDNSAHFDYIFIDSKLNCSNLYKKYPNSKIIIFDNLNIKDNLVSQIVIPSFYINKNLVNRVDKKYRKMLSWGKHYALLSQPLLLKKKISKKILITFGGSDPNNITLKVIKGLAKTSYIERCRVVLGPGYKHDESKLLDIYNDLDIKRDITNLAEEVANASLIVTAVGTTLQELEFYGKKGIIICNYDIDLDDFIWIRKMSRMKNNWQCLGKWDSFDTSDLINNISKMDLKKEKEIDDSNWGASLLSLAG